VLPNIWSLYKERRVYGPILVLVSLFAIQHLAASHVIIFYALDIFHHTDDTFNVNVNPYIASLGQGVIQLVMSIVLLMYGKSRPKKFQHCFLILHNFRLSFFVGRRMIMFVTGSVMSVCALIVGLCMLYIPNHENVIFAFALTYALIGSIGYLNIPWILIGEILPLDVRGKLSGVVVTVAYIMMTVVLKTYMSAIVWLGAAGMFFLFAGFSLMGVIFVYRKLPETKDKSVRDIENYFTRLAIDVGESGAL
jgi:facilitated trehalose transporter